MRKIAVLTTSDIQSSIRTMGAKIPLPDGSCLYSQGGLEWALAQKNLDSSVQIEVVTTRTTPTSTDKWWMDLVDEVFWNTSEKAIDPGFGWRAFFVSHHLAWPVEDRGGAPTPVFWTAARGTLMENPIQTNAEGETIQLLFPTSEKLFGKIWD